MSDIPATKLPNAFDDDAFTFWEGEPLPRTAVSQDVLDAFEPRMAPDVIRAMLAPPPSNTRN